MSNDLVKVENRIVQSMPQGQELTQLLELSKTLASVPYYQKMTPGGVLAVCLTARELNLPVMMCLNGGLYTFDGKVTMSAQLMNMMIVNAGHRADVIKLDETGCWIRFWRKDRKEGHANTFDYSFTYDQAVKAGYMSKNNWKAHPKDMFYSRALSGGARKFMPDVLANAYVFGEIEDATFSDSHLTNTMPEIEIVEPAPIEYVSDQQIQEIKDLISRHSKPNDIEERLMKKYSTYEMIPVDKFDLVIKNILALLKLDHQMQEQNITVKPEVEPLGNTEQLTEEKN
jgi:hypothetical protein